MINPYFFFDINIIGINSIDMPKKVKTKKKKTKKRVVSKIRAKKKNKAQKLFSYYPIVNEDEDFEEKLFKKKEFYIYKQSDKFKSSYEDLCNVKISKDESTLLDQQELLKNFMSPDTPYKSLLIFHGVGVGKTCAAIQIAEGFKETIAKNNGFIYVLASNDAQYNFKQELQNPLCVKYAYASETELAQIEYWENNPTQSNLEKLQKKEKEIEMRMKNVKRGGMYKFMGYATFQNRVIGRVLKDPKTNRDLLNPDGTKKRKIQYPNIKRLDNSLIIIDEAHTIENNDYGEAIMEIKKNSHNLRIVLLSATPMYHSAREIAAMVNFLLPMDEQLDIKNLFETNEELSKVLDRKMYNLTPEAPEILRYKTRGLVSYLRSINPFTYAKMINEGVVPKPIDIPNEYGLKYTHLIRCPMSELQYRTYENVYTGKLPNFMKHMLNMVFPAKDSKYGIFRTEDLVKMHKIYPKSWLSKNGIEFYETPEKHLEISGSILKKNNIGKYSPKFEKLLQILDDLKEGSAFIYQEDIEGIGIKLLANVLIENGYELYNKSNQSNSDKKKFILLSGTIDSKDRKDLIRDFNNPKNKNGEKIKIILGSGVAKESITLMHLRQIHIINYQYDFSSIEQILGRGLRHCSHKLLEADKRQVQIFKYVSSMPNLIDQYKMSLILPKKYKNVNQYLHWVCKNFINSGKQIEKSINKIKKNPDEYYLQSAEEREYNIQEKEHILINKIERILKKNAFDCLLNKKGNIFQEEVNIYKNCETDKNPRLCSALCDYQECSYSCNYNNNDNIVDMDNLEIDTYTKLFARKEIDNSIKLIKEYFKNEFVATIDALEDYIRTNSSLSYIETKFIYEGVQEMIDEQIIFKDKFNRDCYLIYRDIYYILQPVELSEDIPFSYRLMPLPESKIVEMDIGSFLKKAEVNVNISKQGIADTIGKLKAIKGYQTYVALSHMPNSVAITLLKYTIKHLQKNKMSKIFKKILNFFNYSLIYEKDSKSSVSSPVPIGYNYDGNGYIYKNNNWIKTVKESKNKLKEQSIVGFLDELKNGKVIFKVRPPLDNLSDQDRRTIKKGSVCKTTSKSNLAKIANKLGLETDSNFTVNKICRRIERELHRRQINSNKKNLGQRWIYNIIDSKE